MNKFSTWIIVALAVIIAIMLLFWPKSVDTGKDQFEDTIKILRSQKAQIQSRQQATVKTYHKRLSVDSINLRAQDVRIQALQTKLANQRPKVIEKIQADTAVLSYVSTLEEIVTEIQVQNDTLKSALEFHAKVNQDLILLEAIEDRVEADITLQTSVRIADLERSVKKKERKSRLTKILIPIVGVAGVLLGSSL